MVPQNLLMAPFGRSLEDRSLGVEYVQGFSASLSDIHLRRIQVLDDDNDFIIRLNVHDHRCLPPRGGFLLDSPVYHPTLWSIDSKYVGLCKIKRGNHQEVVGSPRRPKR